VLFVWLPSPSFVYSGNLKIYTMKTANPATVPLTIESQKALDAMKKTTQYNTSIPKPSPNKK
jgi:hypothetical protein